MLQPKTRLQIADEYGICSKTLSRRLKSSLVLLPSGVLLPSYQKLIYETLGYPTVVDRESYAPIQLPPETHVA